MELSNTKGTKEGGGQEYQGNAIDGECRALKQAGSLAAEKKIGTQKIEKQESWMPKKYWI